MRDQDTKIVMWFAAVCFTAAAVFAASCKLPPPGTVTRKIIDCAVETGKQQAIGLIAPVNTCLTGGSTTECLLGLINPVAGVTEELIACVVRSQGAEFNAAAAINVSDTRSWRAAENARVFISKRGYEFKDGP